MDDPDIGYVLQRGDNIPVKHFIEFYAESLS